MLLANRKYLFQLIRSADGNRADPFVMTPAELQETIVKEYKSETADKFYVLVLADCSTAIKPQELVSKFPLFTLESWTNLQFNTEDLENA